MFLHGDNHRHMDYVKHTFEVNGTNFASFFGHDRGEEIIRMIFY